MKTNKTKRRTRFRRTWFGNKFMTVPLLFASLLFAPSFAEMHPAVQSMKKRLEKRTNQTETCDLNGEKKMMITKKDLDQHFEIYRDPSSKASLIMDYFFGFDDTLKTMYFDMFISLCDSTEPSLAFINMCKFVELNSIYITESQLETAILRALSYGTEAVQNIPAQLYELRDQYYEGLYELRKMYERLTDKNNKTRDKK